MLLNSEICYDSQSELLLCHKIPYKKKKTISEIFLNLLIKFSFQIVKVTLLICMLKSELKLINKF